MNLTIIVLAAVFVLIAVRRIGNVRLQIWQVMLAGAVVVLMTGQITPLQALKSINLDVMLFLFGMFVVGYALEESGYLSRLSFLLFSRTRSMNQLVLVLLFGFGFASALLMNDTLAIIGTPVVLALAKRHRSSPQMMLIALCFAVTVGSVMSPIGNPQNLLIALTGRFSDPFVSFVKYLFLPTMINLIITFLALRLIYRKEFGVVKLTHTQETPKDSSLARLSQWSLAILVVLVVLKILVVVTNSGFDFKLTYIALAAAVPIVALSPRRLNVIRGIDWRTLVFFAAMFVVMAAVWNSGFFQRLLNGSSLNIGSVVVILLVSVVVSQFTSNVPLVALYLPLLVNLGVGEKGMLALAAGSTIAGNLLILGAASNVIIIQNAEQRTGDSLGFLQFARIGAPLTVVHVFVYWIFLVLI